MRRFTVQPLHAVAVAWFAASLGCLPRGLPAVPDYSFSRPVPRAFRTVAVVPFCGDEALSRPAEEAVAHRLREQQAVGVMAPFQVGRALDASSKDEWRRAVQQLVKTVEAGEPSTPLPPELPASARGLAAALGADALLFGTVSRGGAVIVASGPIQEALAGLLLVDGASGEAVAFVFRTSTPAPARVGIHEAAMDAAIRSADVVRAVLRANPGERPPVRRSVEAAPASEPEVAP